MTANLDVYLFFKFLKSALFKLFLISSELVTTSGEEGVAKLYFVKSTEANLIVSATPPIKYVNEIINDIVEDIIIVRDEIEEFVDGQSIGTFIYDKGIILVFKDHQIGIELDSWMAEMIAVFRSSNALSKFTPLDYEWGDDGQDSNCRFDTK
ncbi:MAG: hypothetical protein KIB47_01215 [Clostridium sp.]|nr:hypothetical protein [Clostridium sp.]